MAAAALAGCTSEPAAEVRPLISDTEGNYVVNSLDTTDVQRGLDAIAVTASQVSTPGDTFADIPLDLLNEEFLDTTIVTPDRNVFVYGAGTEAAGWAADKDSAILVGASENASCWVLRMTGTPADPVIEYSAMFDPQCNAEKAKASVLKWTKSWPPAPKYDPKAIPSDAPTSGIGPGPQGDPGPASAEPSGASGLPASSN